jgi:glycine cleavage system transcriptional repressor
MARAVIATIGEDRPGLVNELTEVVLQTQLNIEDSRMTVLGGEFAVLMTVAGSEGDLSTLETRLGELAARTGLAHLFRRTSDRARTDAEVHVVKVEAVDHPGIVHGIAGFFSQRGINIRELETETRPAAHTGAPVFNVRLEIEVPAATAVAELRGAFEEFCASRDLDGEMVAP